ncbi:MAG: MBL fold metallo-hydrolase [Opitutae bacterium]|nr:MBL fold metallo-hydrolase [Opitutae bacterium]|tara:strand:- start:4239 stop:4880 length:642 start_codon:yes stop_codon:yes gene_type:complete
MSDLQLQKFELGPIGTNAFLVWEENGTEAILVDAPPQAKETIAPILATRGLRLSALWLTHGHWDHMAGAAELTSGEMTVLGHKDDLELFENPQCMSSFAMPGMEFQPISVTQWVSNKDKLELFGRDVEVLHVPGHCPGNVAFHVPSEGWCFVGDAIFAGSIGRTDLPGGDFATLEKSIKDNLYTLPPATSLHPGHGPDTTVEREMATNPFVPA